MIDARAGSGGMGDIYKGVDRETGGQVAIKLLRPTASPHERARFAREVAVLADLRHPNIVQYIAHGTWRDDRLFFAMEWLDGEDLGQRQRRAPLGMRDAVEVVRRSAAAMAAIHARGVVHRDLKMSNIFLLRGRGTAVKLIDFGVVKPQVPDEYPTERGTIIGTPHFMAPEQAKGEPIDVRADVYSLGAVLFRLVTGRNVFETEHVIALLGRLVLEDPPRAQQIRFDVPEALDEVISNCLARDRDARYEDGGELARILARVAAQVLNNDPPATDRSASAIRRATQIPESKPLSSSQPLSSTSGVNSELGTPSRPGVSERRVVACVLYDLGGAELSPDLHATLRDVLGDDARLEPLAGNQLVAVLGVDRSRGDEPLRAARAALTVARALPGARVALAIGRATRATGGRQSITGEALERAARQLEAAAPGTVRVDGAATAALAGRFVVQEDPKGGVLLHEDTLGLDGRRLIGRPSPTIGRDHELTLLQGIYSDILTDGTPRAAVVTGPAGIGKSRVRSELVQRLEASPKPPLVMLCRGDPMSRGASISALGRALRALMGIHDGESADEQMQKVAYHVSTRLPRTLRFLSAFLGEIIGVPFPDENDEPLRAARGSAQIMQSRMRMALEAYIRSQAERAPLVVVIEDLHWVDDTTIDLVDWLLGCTDLRFGVLAFARPEIDTRLPTLWERRNLTRLTLPPLSPHAAERLVAAVLPRETTAMRTALVQRAGGNALFLEELVRSAAEGRDDVPLTVQSLVQLRLDRLSPDAREVLRAASVFGQCFWTAGVATLLERSATAELTALEASEIITRQPESRIANHVEWMFCQALVRDVVYASLLDEDRAALHLSASAWLEAVGDVDAALIAHHADAGGDRTRAAVLYAHATHHAITRGAQLVTALELASRGLACGASGELRAGLLLDKAHAHAGMGQLHEGIQAAQEAASLAAPSSDLWGEAHRLAAGTLMEAGLSADGDALAAWAARPDVAPGLSPSLRAALLAVRVRGLVDLDRPREALDVARHAVDTARASGSPVAVTRALDALLFAMPPGEISDAITTGLSLVQAAEDAGDALIATRARLNTASLLNQVGLFEDAQTLLTRALGDARSRRMRILEAAALHNLGMTHARLGDLDSGIEHERQAGLIADECQAARLRIQTRTYEVIFLIWRGAPGDMATALSLATRLCDETSRYPALQVTAWFTLARAQLTRRAYEGALVAAREAYQRLAGGPIEEWEEYTRLTLVEALIATGHLTEADAILDEAFHILLERAKRIHNPYQRSAFLRRNDEIDRLLHLARERLGRTLPPLDATADQRTPTMGPNSTR
ncbi:Hypothetical protein CAP_6546 [Chondromyces apiculatus DSM 436]|uniref:Protein kinase domain-containing protein n=1 Tax=Chondromyces apiculatus DSM 436 TaxID=1192034 RepID=A0A017T2M5_9BACT|nr:Hypothetical protein CAP_6546 [Chondromyces apiculatus DSM 436]